MHDARARGRLRLLRRVHIVDDDATIAVDHEVARLFAQRRFEHGDEREIFGRAAVAVTGGVANLDRLAA